MPKIKKLKHQNSLTASIMKQFHFSLQQGGVHYEKQDQKNYIYLFFYLFIFCCAGSLLLWRLFANKWGLFFVVHRLLIALTSCVAEHRLQGTGFSSCSLQAQQLWLLGSRAQAQQLWHTGLVAPRHVGSSQTRDLTCLSCIGRQILYHLSHQGRPTYSS